MEKSESLPTEIVNGVEYTKEMAGVKVIYQPAEGVSVLGGVNPHLRTVGSEATGFATSITREQYRKLMGGN